MSDKIEKEYNELSKRLKLPKFKEIDSEFELSSLEHERFLIKNILKKIIEKLEFHIEWMDNLVHPDGSSISSMYELKSFSDEEKNDMYKLFKKLMKNHREAAISFLENNEKKQADFLNKFINEWVKIKKELIPCLDKMKESWEKESSIEEDVGYLG